MVKQPVPPPKGPRGESLKPPAPPAPPKRMSGCYENPNDPRAEPGFMATGHECPTCGCDCTGDEKRCPGCEIDRLEAVIKKALYSAQPIAVGRGFEISHEAFKALADCFDD